MSNLGRQKTKTTDAVCRCQPKLLPPLYLLDIMQNDIMFLLHAGEIPGVGTSIFCIAHKNVV